MPTVEEIMTAQAVHAKVEVGDPLPEGYGRNEAGLIYYSREGRELVWIPSVLVPRVLTYCHGPAFVGHFGRDRMLRRIQNRFWWARMKTTCDSHIAKCFHCSLERLSKKEEEKGVLRSLETLRRFDQVAIDVITVIPRSHRGNLKVLVIIDTFSRYVVAVLLPDEAGKTVAQAFLEHWVYRFGPPERLLSDRGTNFTGEMLGNMCDMLGTKKMFSTPYRVLKAMGL